MGVKIIFNRAIWVYILLAVFFRFSIDFSQAAKERSHYLLGIFYNGSYKNYSDGIVYFDHLIRFQPSAVNFANLGTCYYQRGDFKKALYYYREAFKRNPESTLLGQQVDNAAKKLPRQQKATPIRVWMNGFLGGIPPRRIENPKVEEPRPSGRGASQK